MIVPRGIRNGALPSGEEEIRNEEATFAPACTSTIPPGPWTPPVIPPPMPEQPKNRHFGMTVTLDNTRVVRNVGNLMDEVINHLMNVDGAKVEIRLLVDAIMPDGTPAPVVRTVTENCRTLHVEDCGFDD